MITGVHVKGYRNHRETAVEGLGPLTVIVGPNGSGKTNFLRALVDFGQWFEAGKDSPAVPEPAYVEVSTVMNGAPRQVGLFTGAKRPAANDVCGKLPIRFLKLSGAQVAAPSVPREQPPQLARDGWGLASCLRYLMTNNRRMFDQTYELARAVIPSLPAEPEPVVKALPLRRVEDGMALATIGEEGYEKVAMALHGIRMNDTLGADELWLAGRPATSASDGTLLCLAILTELVMTDRPVLVDDIESGLHPAAQRELLVALRHLVSLREGAQIIMTTHSPYVIDEMKPEEVWVFVPDAEGDCLARRLSDHPDATRALEVLTTGEFWSAEGEQWVREAAVHG